jgi:hypothetical protein
MDPFQVVKNLGADDRQDVLKFTIPQVISYDEEGWKEDEEFARQRIAGNNPILIKLLTVKSCSSPFVMTMMMISFILLLSHFHFNILLQHKI